MRWLGWVPRVVNPGGWFLSPLFLCASVSSCRWRMQAILMECGPVKTILKLSPNSVNCLQAILMGGGLVRPSLRLLASLAHASHSHGNGPAKTNLKEGGRVETTLDTVSLHGRMQDIFMRWVCETILELSLRSATDPTLSSWRWAFETTLEIVGLSRSLQALSWKVGLLRQP